MKIRKLKYNNHKILGNLELDFVNPETGQPYNTIVLVGENGTGKTTILKSISDYINVISLRPFDYIEYEANGGKFRIEPLPKGNDTSHKRKDLMAGIEEEVERDNYNNAKSMLSDKNDMRHYACAFSKARADFKTNKISNVSTKKLDLEIHDGDNEDNYTSLKQLIVDIDNQDNSEYTQRNKVTRLDYAQFLPTSRMYRFSNAFNTFFGEISFDRIVDVDNEKVIMFKKNGKDVPIDELSTGEKQIVFRGAYLLKNSGNMEDGVAFIDEPELSMHPSWQQKILDYFRNLYTDSAGNQKAQLFFASHSEYVVASALKSTEDVVVIVLMESGGVISSRKITTPIVLPSIVASEVNYAAFDIPTIDYHIALYGAIQAKYNKQKIADCDAFIENCTCYNKRQHEMITTNPNSGKQYKTLPTKVRNGIDHPDTAPDFTEEEMKKSIELMRNILLNIP